MAKTDWKLTDVVKPDDFNDIGQEINKLRGDLDNIDIPTASLTKAGITQLSSATDSEAEDRAATPKAVKAATDAARKAQNAADDANTAAATVQKELKDAIADIVINGTEAVEEVKKELQELETRLNTADTDEITLQPGLQVVSAAKDARFNLGSIKGKSEINGQGRIGIIGVENPYVIRYGENLLPPFYEWDNTSGGGAYYKFHGPYVIEQYSKDAVNHANSVIHIPVIPGQTYTLNAGVTKNPSDIPDALFFYWLDADGNRLAGEGKDTRKYKGTYTVPSNARFMQMYVVMEVIDDNTAYKTQIVSEPMLTLGAKAKPFKPREDSMLAFQTELHANPTDGSDQDELFEQGGEYRKLAKWKKVVITGSVDGVVYEAPQSFTGYKRIRLRNIGPEPLVTPSYIAFATKYNVDRLMRMDQSTGAGSFAIGSDSGNYLLMHISSADTGWGDAYTPTADEIKAYFNGWRMFDGSVNGEPYNGSGTKTWNSIMHWGTPTYVTTATPTTQAPNWSPYNLLYRLAKEVVESVVSEGCLTLNEGDNVVEVGTGIMLRERANVVYDATYQNYLINDPGAHGSMLKYKTNQLIAVNKERKDFNWRFMDNGSGGQRAVCPMPNFDQSASYSVTYLKLDKSPVVPILGVVAANEKAQLSDLTSGVAEALHGVSVLTQKKAEKDAPGWITPTLINGWIVSSGLGYKKIGRIVYVELHLTSGSITSASTIFKLPKDYWPSTEIVKQVWCRNNDASVVNGDGVIQITRSGEVQIGIGVSQNGLLLLSFYFEIA